MAREPRSKLYDGVAYGRLVDPLLAGVHGYIANHLPEGKRVLDACCGTGSLARRLTADGRRVVGVDLSPRNIRYARGRNAGQEIGQLPTFEIADVSQLTTPTDGAYDVATMVLALHEMPHEARADVLAALLRVAARVMVVDFAAPMPRNLAGMRNRAMELAAGSDHFRAFRDYSRRGGLAPLIEAAGTDVESERTIDDGTLRVLVLRGRPR